MMMLTLDVGYFFRSIGDFVVAMLSLVVVGLCHIDGIHQDVFRLRYLLVPHVMV